MGLSVGIVGLPNVGKSTLFNALASRRLAVTAAHPFTTIEPHEAVVPVPDAHLAKLAQLVRNEERVMSPPEVVPATVTFIDIAGLVKGAHKGEGLGNQFLGKIREVDAIVHVVRAFEDPNVVHVHGAIDPKEDIEVVNLELELGGITEKPTIYVVNVDESRMSNVSLPARPAGGPAGKAGNSIKSIKSVTGSSAVIVVCAKLEEELADLDPEERRQYLKELGIEKSGLEQLVEQAYRMLGLITFYTIKGGREVRAWSLRAGSTALEAAGQVHTDFAKSFIKAEVINVGDLLEAGSWNKAKQVGKVRLEGRDYVVQDGDVVEFKIGT